MHRRIVGEEGTNLSLCQEKQMRRNWMRPKP
jgi:hypothetical protein